MTKKKKTRTALTDRERQFCESYERNAADLPAVASDLGISLARCRALLESPLVKDRLARSVQIARERLEATAPHLV